MLEDEKKEIDPMFIEECVQVVYRLEVLDHFTSGPYFEPRYWNILGINFVSFWSKYLNQFMVQNLYKFIYLNILNILIKIKTIFMPKMFQNLRQNMFKWAKCFSTPNLYTISISIYIYIYIYVCIYIYIYHSSIVLTR